MQLRGNVIANLPSTVFDVLVVGGGINGAVSAAALSAKGARVALIDRGDFAGVTSQSSSNLAWGGIKYLENFEFGLVRKLCRSRNRLMKAYPSTVQEIRFFVPHARGFRHSRLKIFSGTWLYWLMGNCYTRRPRWLTRRAISAEEGIVNLDNVDGGYEYSDAFFCDNDARLTFGFIRTALNHGCMAANYVESQQAHRKGDLWTVVARDQLSQQTLTIRARTLINACGPFVDAHNRRSGQATKHHHAFSKGIHLIVPRMTQNRRVLTFVANDGRMFFMVPMGPRTCIGTTDTRVEQPTAEVTAADRDFVLENANRLLQLPAPLTQRDVIAERCGVRPLVVSAGQSGGNEDWTQLSRKHVLECNAAEQHISIFGGKLTDCLNVGEQICRKVKKLGIALPFAKQRWYGEPSEAVKQEFYHQATLMRLDDLTAASSSELLTSRLWRRYGAHALDLLEDIRSDPSMTDVLIENAEYLRCEIKLAARSEMVAKLEDFLWRRSKIALVVSPDTLRNSPGLHEACNVLFPGQAAEKLAEYFQASETEA